MKIVIILVLECLYKENKSQCNIKYIFNQVTQPTNQPKALWCILKTCENTTNFSSQNEISLEILLYITCEVDWVSCEEGNQYIKVIFQESFVRHYLSQVLHDQGQGVKLVIFLYLKCLGHVEPNRVVIITPKPILKLKFSFGITP